MMFFVISFDVIYSFNAAVHFDHDGQDRLQKGIGETILLNQMQPQTCVKVRRLEHRQGMGEKRVGSLHDAK
jgi:hypothetical protein